MSLAGIELLDKAIPHAIAAVGRLVLNATLSGTGRANEPLAVLSTTNHNFTMY